MDMVFVVEAQNVDRVAVNKFVTQYSKAMRQSPLARLQVVTM